MNKMFGRTVWVLFLAAACEDKTPKPTAAAPTAAATATAAPTPTPAASPKAPEAAATDAAPAVSAAPARFNPKHKCPTGQTHFYMEGDFCRRKCITNSDCGNRERCSAIEYPFVLDGGAGGMSKFCEGY